MAHNVITKDVLLTSLANELLIEKLQELIYVMETVKIPDLGIPERFTNLRIITRNSPDSEHMIFIMSTKPFNQQ